MTSLRYCPAEAARHSFETGLKHVKVTAQVWAALAPRCPKRLGKCLLFDLEPALSSPPAMDAAEGAASQIMMQKASTRST